MRYHAQQIITAAIAAVLPGPAVRAALSQRHFPGRVVLVAIGKAAWSMAQAAREMVPDCTGVVITKYGHSQGDLPGLVIVEAGHPLPDENTLRGTQLALEAVRGLTPQDAVLFLISGGGSALFEQPLPGVTLADMEDVTRQLLHCGAAIGEINTIRKRLSAVKAGRFALTCAPTQVLSIVLSDVLGDHLDTIASGPAYPDSTTVQQAQDVARRYQLQLPPHIAALLAQETPKELLNVETHVIGSVTVLAQAAAQAAQAVGYTPYLLTSTLDCEARDAGRFCAALARQIHTGNTPFQRPCALLMGGETVVHVTGQGLGGRNQELALATAQGIAGLPDTLIFSLGSDGTDGPTDVAGGMVDGDTASVAAEAGILLDAALANNDAYHALERLNGLIRTGPTGTNVNDITVLLVK